MSKKKFSNEEINKLSINKYVKKLVLKQLHILMNLKFILSQNTIMEKLQE